MNTGTMMKAIPLVLLSVCLSAHLTQAQTTATLQTHLYTASFRISAPADWVVRDDVGLMRMVAGSPMGEGDTFRESMNVVFEGLATPVTLDQYVQAQAAQMEQAAPGISWISSDGRELNGHPARRVVFEYSAGGRQLEFIQYLLVMPTRAYVLTGTATSETFEQYLPLFEQMAASFSVQ